MGPLRCRLGCAYVETDEAKADEWTIISNIAKGHYSNPVKVIALDSLNWVRDIVLTAHANKIGLAIIFEFNHGRS